MSKSSQFLHGILGPDGSAALIKAIDREASLGSALVPRAVLSWLGVVARGSYTGTLPGVESVSFNMRKAETGFSGNVTIGPENYEFKNASVYHVGAALTVALGVDQAKVSDKVRAATLQKLGKSIDTLVKARIYEEQTLKKAISAIPPGKEMQAPVGVDAKSKHLDYSHVLSPGQRRAGYGLSVVHSPDSGTVIASLSHQGQRAGQVKGSHFDNQLHIEDAEIDPEHQGKGLGQASYEALMAHGLHNGIKAVAGGTHSTSASKVHQALAQKHGLGYVQQPTPFPQLAAPNPSPYDAKYSHGGYAIKAELKATAKVEEPGSSNKPTKQMAPEPPQAPNFQAAAPKPLKKPKLSITKSESLNKCGMCGRTQFQGDRFTGCLCFTDLHRGVDVKKTEKGYDLVFKSEEWDFDMIEALALLLKPQT